MRHFVTVIENSYLPYFLVLHESLRRIYATDFVLWVVAVDDEVLRILERMQLSNVSAFSDKAIWDPELKDIKTRRTLGEYCWTLTPFLPTSVWDRESSVDVITYIDADIWVLKNPEPLLREYEESAAVVQVTPHYFAPSWDQTEASGRFCVQFQTYRRAPETDRILRDWRLDCLAGLPDRAFSDQKFLDAWPSRYGASVNVLSMEGAILGPWNAQRFPYSEAYLYHFQGLRYRTASTMWIGANPIPRPTIDNVYHPYLRRMRLAMDLLESEGWTVTVQDHPLGRLRRAGAVGARMLRGASNLRAGTVLRIG